MTISPCSTIPRRSGAVAFALLLCTLMSNVAAQGMTDDGAEFGPDSRTREYLRLSPVQREAERSRTREVAEIRIARQFGLGYLPLMVMRQNQLIEKHAAAAHLDAPHVRWTRFPSGKTMNDALRLGLLDVAVGGVTPFVAMWDRSLGGSAVKGVAALSSMPMYLNTTSMAVQGIKDFGPDDRIALPATGVSIQAITLQMEASRVLGADNFARLDARTVSMAHPKALRALLDGNAGITAHFATPPYQYQELDDTRVRTVVNSFDTLGGPATFTMIWAREGFEGQNPRTMQAIYSAVGEAIERIEADKQAAARVYLQQSRSSLSVDRVAQILEDPQVRFSRAPSLLMQYVQFMHKTGTITNRPSSWRELFFPVAHAELGN